MLPALLTRFCGGAGVGSGPLGPGLTSESADALSGCPANDSSAGSQVFSGTHQWRRPDLPVLCKRPGFTGPAASRCVPSLNRRKGMAMAIVKTHAITGGVDTHADGHVAAALDPIGGLLGVQEFPATAAGYAGLPGWLDGFGTVALAGIEGTGSYGAGLASRCGSWAGAARQGAGGRAAALGGVVPGAGLRRAAGYRGCAVRVECSGLSGLVLVVGFVSWWWRVPRCALARRGTYVTAAPLPLS
jgi:hypothetical protein